MTEVIAQNRGYFFQKALFEMFDKILSSPLKPATSVEKATSQIYEVSPLINSENLEPFAIFAKLLAVSLLNLITLQYCARSNPRHLIFNIFVK